MSSSNGVIDTTAVHSYKLFVKQLIDATPQNGVWTVSATNLTSIIFKIAWIQGTVTQASTDGVQFLVDDGTSGVNVDMSAVLKRDSSAVAKPGDYVMVVGVVLLDKSKTKVLKAQKFVDLSSTPDRRQMWKLEVDAIQNDIYFSLSEERRSLAYYNRNADMIHCIPINMNASHKYVSSVSDEYM
eukprot:CFRG1962T1